MLRVAKSIIQMKTRKLNWILDMLRMCLCSWIRCVKKKSLLICQFISYPSQPPFGFKKILKFVLQNTHIKQNSKFLRFGIHHIRGCINIYTVLERPLIFHVVHISIIFRREKKLSQNTFLLQTSSLNILSFFY